MMPYGSRAFTLIELLIVVAIIAILAAIAVPSFLEAQVRAKVSRAQGDMRSLATALEAYATDANRYPPGFFKGLGPDLANMRSLTSPVAYIAILPSDPFDVAEGGTTSDLWWGRGYAYGAGPIDEESRWILASDGPDRVFGGSLAEVDDHLSFVAYGGYSPGMFYDLGVGPAGTILFDYQIYDSSNGSISQGEVVRASDFQAGE